MDGLRRVPRLAVREPLSIKPSRQRHNNLLLQPGILPAVDHTLASDWEQWDEKKSSFKLTPNSGFLPAIEQQLAKKGLNKDSRIVVMCRSGSRSAKAAKLLAEAGYKNVYSVVDGFEGDKAKEGPNKGQRVVNGWKNANLPWSYKLDKEKMYWEM